jgi:hypothetical protein
MNGERRMNWQIEELQEGWFLFTCHVPTKLGGVVRYSGRVRSNAAASEFAALTKDLETRAMQLVAAEVPV